MTAKELIAIAEDHATCGSKTSALVNLIKAVAKLEEQVATATVKDSLTAAPDPGPGWRLIDPKEDTPQDGDEMWVKQWHGWYDRGYQRQTAPFEEGTHYRRRVDAKPRKRYPDVPTMLRDVVGGEEGEAIAKEVERTAALPDGLPPLPEGAVYLGVGGTFKEPEGYFYGWWLNATYPEWQEEHYCAMSSPTAHFAAPADSEVARLNGLGPTLKDEQQRVEKLAERYEELDEAAQLRKQVATLTKERDEARDIAADLDTQLKVKDARIANLEQERDALREKLNAERKRIKAIREAIGSFNNVIHMTNAESNVHDV